MEARKKQERDFHDRIRTVQEDFHVADTRWSPEMETTISTNPMWANMKYYAVERASRDYVLSWYKEHCPGKTALDYCCGNGADSIEMARAGARRVVGIDISDVSITNCTRLAESEGLSDRCQFENRDAEATGFADGSFEVISEYGSLDHLDLAKALEELSRILKPDGKLIGDETLGHNPIIAAYRRATPHLRTPWEAEHILRKRDFLLMKRYFEKVEIRFFHLFTLLAVPFRRTPVFRPLLRLMELLDGVVLRIPGVRWYAWQAIIVLSSPKRGRAGDVS